MLNNQRYASTFGRAPATKSTNMRLIVQIQRMGKGIGTPIIEVITGQLNDVQVNCLQ